MLHGTDFSRNNVALKSLPRVSLPLKKSCFINKLTWTAEQSSKTTSRESEFNISNYAHVSYRGKTQVTNYIQSEFVILNYVHVTYRGKTHVTNYIKSEFVISNYAHVSNDGKTQVTNYLRVVRMGVVIFRNSGFLLDQKARFFPKKLLLK